MRSRSALYRGALLNTILRNDTFFFSQLGTFLERADNTARILDVKYYVLLPQIEMVGGGVDNVQWGAILRSVSAHRSYRWVYKQNYRPWRIAEYLILNQAMPRSLRSCYDEINLALERSRRALRRQVAAATRPRPRRAACSPTATSTGSSSRGCTSSSRISSCATTGSVPRSRRAYHFNG